MISWSATPAAAAKKKPLPTALAGCRTLSVAYDPYVPDPSVRARVSKEALDLLQKAKNPELSALVHRTATTDANSAYFVDIGAWCKAHYPKDKVVRGAKYPTNSASTV